MCVCVCAFSELCVFLVPMFTAAATEITYLLGTNTANLLQTQIPTFPMLSKTSLCMKEASDRPVTFHIYSACLQTCVILEELLAHSQLQHTSCDYITHTWRLIRRVKQALFPPQQPTAYTTFFTTTTNMK